MVLVVPPVYHFEISKGDVADGYIKKAVRHLHRFKSINGNAGTLIELLGNTPGNGILLYTIGFAARHISRKQTDKLPVPQAGSKMLPCWKPICASALVNASNHYGRGVEGSQRTGSGRCILVLIQQGLEFRILAVCFLKALGQPTPSHIAGKDFLFLRCGKAFFRFDPFQAADGSDVGGKLFGPVCRGPEHRP